MNLRKFIRHPTDIPIEVWLVNNADERKAKPLSNVSLSGLAFKANRYWEPGSIIGIRIPIIDPQFQTVGRVVWCQQQSNQLYFDVGVEFLTPIDAFRTRMIEQVCQIEQYRQQVLAQGRVLSSHEAAQEWIARYAANFFPMQSD
jgi:hypothetical protein